MAAANGHHEEWGDTIEKARALLEEGRKEMARAADMAREKGHEALESARMKSKEAWDAVRAKGLHAVDDLKDKSEEVWEDTEKLVKKHPGRAIGISLVAGIVIGFLLSRDRD
jgi:ElaB/YqjD/DUF883 family membrane-anchored ribosome-binding protein